MDELIQKAHDEAKGMSEPYKDFGTLVEWLVDKTPPIDPGINEKDIFRVLRKVCEIGRIRTTVRDTMSGDYGVGCHCKNNETFKGSWGDCNIDVCPYLKDMKRGQE